jgi:hypothetical protein
MTQEALKLALEALEMYGNRHRATYLLNGAWDEEITLGDKAITAIKEALTKEKALQALHSENERLGLYKDAYAQPEPVAVVDVHEFYDNCANFSLLQKLPKGKHTLYTTSPQRTELKIKTTDPFESARVGDYNRGWNDCLFASGIVKQPEQEPRNVRERWNVELDGNDLLVCFNDHEKGDKCQYERYSPQRTWVGLTDEEVRKICVNEWGGYEQCRAIEAKFKEKNGFAEEKNT